MSLDSSPSGVFVDCAGIYTRVIKRGALETLKVIDPLTAANYIGQSNTLEDKIRAKSIVEATLATTRKNEWPLWLQRLSGLSSTVPEGLLAMANIKLSMKAISLNEFEDSETWFESANEAYKERHYGTE